MNKAISKTSAQPVSEQTLVNQVEQLSKCITPQRDLWQGIEHAISQTPQDDVFLSDEAKQLNSKKIFAPISWAASIVVAVLVTWLTIKPMTTENTEVVKVIVDETSVAQNISTDVATLMHENFEQQKQAMLVSFGDSKSAKISPLMEQQLIELASARRAIEKALSTDKNNADLLNLLRFTQQQELNLIQQLYSPKWQSI